MKTITPNSLNSDTLKNVYQIEALLVDNVRPVIAHRPPTPTVHATPYTQTKSWQSILLTDQNGLPFNSLEDAINTIQPYKKSLSQAEFVRDSPSRSAKNFLTELSNLNGSDGVVYDAQMVSLAGVRANLSSTDLEGVLTELNGRFIDRGANGTITVIPQT